MSAVYDNWERLVAAVIKKQQLWQLWQLFHAHSPSPSILSEASYSSSRLRVVDQASIVDELTTNKVIIHVRNDEMNNFVMPNNSFLKLGIALHRIFHSAVEVYGEEWSFGFCEQGSGVYSCPSTKNPMYTYRESILLGETEFSRFKVNQILRELSREFPGHSYDLLEKNCNNFCDEFCRRLGVQKLPGWVNRYVRAGDAAMGRAGNTAYWLKQARTEIVSASKVAYWFFAGASNNVVMNSDSLGRSNSTRSRGLEETSFKNLLLDPNTSSISEREK